MISFVAVAFLANDRRTFHANNPTNAISQLNVAVKRWNRTD